MYIGLVAYALGSALPVFTELLVRAPEVAGEDIGDHKARDFSVAILFKTLGTLLGTPAMTAIWAQGIQLGGAALGLPFLTSAVGCHLNILLTETDYCQVVYAIASLLLWMLRRN